MTAFNQTAGFTIAQLQAQLLEEQVTKVLNEIRQKLLTALQEDLRRQKTTHTIYINVSDYKSELLVDESIKEVEKRLLEAQGTPGVAGEWNLQPIKRMQGTWYFEFTLIPAVA